MKKSNVILFTLATLAVAKGLDNRLEISHYRVKSDELPTEFDGFRIVHISDFHCDKTAGLIDAIRNERPDIICATGDMAHDTGSFEPFINLLQAIINIAPVYIVSGNHDVWRSDYKEMVKRCRNLGAIYLEDERVFINKGEDKIAITGISDPFSSVGVTINENIDKSLEKLTNYDGYEVVLFHRANFLDKFKNRGYNLVLSGHMHGGQFRIPKVGGVVSPKTNFNDKTKIFFPKYFGGEYGDKNTKMIVSRGVGNPTFLPRVFNRPEICSITLNRE